MVVFDKDVYVFCLLAHKDRATLDPLDLTQWTFLVLPTSTLNDRLGSQKTIGLARLLALEPDSVSFAELGDAVERAARR